MPFIIRRTDKPGYALGTYSVTADIQKARVFSRRVDCKNTKFFVSPRYSLDEEPSHSTYEIEEVSIVTTKALESLREDAHKLLCLEGAGVDNWSGYDFAMEEFYTEEPLE